VSLRGVDVDPLGFLGTEDRILGIDIIMYVNRDWFFVPSYPLQPYDILIVARSAEAALEWWGLWLSQCTQPFSTP
jgi:hypothetical protein